jgi:hypothetical protein
LPVIDVCCWNAVVCGAASPFHLFGQHITPDSLTDEVYVTLFKKGFDFEQKAR